MISRAIMISVVIISLPFVNTLQLRPNVMPPSEGAKVLNNDVIQSYDARKLNIRNQKGEAPIIIHYQL